MYSTLSRILNGITMCCLFTYCQEVLADDTNDDVTDPIPWYIYIYVIIYSHAGLKRPGCKIIMMIIYDDSDGNNHDKLQ